MKKILALAAVAALTAGVSAYAANPFSDVSPDDWAYQAISDLSVQGVVEGYPDGTFQGERNMTRYELAQIIARLMAREDQLNAEQQAILAKLTSEYADELANLGVRVSNLEKKVGNIYWSGDARMRYQTKDNAKKEDSWNGRMRINIKGQVNEDTYVQGRIVGEMDFKDSSDKKNDTYMDQIFVNHQFGKYVSVRLGRQPIFFGNQGGWLYGSTKGYDGGQVSFNNGKLEVTAGWGQLNYTDDANGYWEDSWQDKDAFFAKAAYDFGVLKLNADYITLEESDKDDEVFGFGIVVPIQKFNVFGEYWQNSNTSSDYDTAWNAGVSYGKADWKKPWSWDLSVAYNDVDRDVYFGGTGLQTDILDALKRSYGATNINYWNVIGNITLQKNVQLHAEYAFGGDADGAADPDDAWTVSLNYKF